MCRPFLAFLLSAFLALPALAGHYSGGNITYSCLGNNQYEVTLTLFVDCSGAAIIPQDLLFASSCGTSFTVQNLPPSEGTEVSQLCEAQIGNSTCNGGSLPGMRRYTFTTIQTLSACDGWTISWNICCRANTVNLVGVPGMYLETTLFNSTAPCDGSPVFAEDALPYVCVNQPVTYNFGVSDPEGDSLTYAFVSARTWLGDQQAPVSYQGGFSGAEPIPGITLDAATGQVDFTPTAIGYYVVAVEINAFNDAGALTGRVIRDILFVVIDCSNNNPDATSGTVENIAGNATPGGDYAVQSCVNPSFCFDATISDADALQNLTLASNVDQVIPGATFEVTGTNPATATVCITNGNIAPGSYVFTINATDDACPQPASQILTYTVLISEGTTASGDTAICPGDVAQLSAVGGTAFSWTPGASLNDPTLQSVSAAPAMTTTYSVTSDLPVPCNVASVTVTVLDAGDPACLNTAVPILQDSDAPRLYPDPTGGSLSVDLGTSSVADVQRLFVVDVTGRVRAILRPSERKGVLSIELPGALENGTYLLRARGGAHLGNFRLVR